MIDEGEGEGGRGRRGRGLQGNVLCCLDLSHPSMLFNDAVFATPISVILRLASGCRSLQSEPDIVILLVIKRSVMNVNYFLILLYRAQVPEIVYDETRSGYTYLLLQQL